MDKQTSNLKLPSKGNFRIRAYCTKCGKLLQESNSLTMKQLRSLWDRSVIQAVSIGCNDCKTKFPNFELELRIYDSKLKYEMLPEKKIHIRRKEEPLSLFKSIAHKWLDEHPEYKEVTLEEAKESMEQAKEELNNGETTTNGEGN